MKRYILTLLCAVLGYSTLYASFPVVIDRVIEHAEIEPPIKSLSISDPTPLANWSFALGLLWAPFLLISAVYSFSDSDDETSPVILLFAAIASFIGAIITGLISLSRKEGNTWKAVIGLSLTLGVILLGILSSGLSGVFY
tara:strand:+ start:1340 stop:1759 length:420 start_codon:yes stop_codon:yes gene_type:complete